MHKRLLSISFLGGLIITPGPIHAQGWFSKSYFYISSAAAGLKNRFTEEKYGAPQAQDLTVKTPAREFLPYLRGMIFGWTDVDQAMKEAFDSRKEQMRHNEEVLSYKRQTFESQFKLQQEQFEKLLKQNVAIDDSRASSGNSTNIINVHSNTDNNIFKKTETKDLVIDADSKIMLQTILGDIEVIGDGCELGKLIILKEANSEEDLANVTTNITHSNNQLSIITKYLRSPSSGKVSYKLLIPTKKLLQIAATNTDGLILVKNIEADLTAQSRNGAITAQIIKGNAVLDSINGKILAELIYGDCQAKTVNGAIKAGVEGAFNAQSTNGSISLIKNKVNHLVAIKTVLGNISVHSNYLDAFLKAKVVKGKFKSDFILASSSRSARKGKIESKIGHGGPQIMLDTVHGNIELLKN
jgi:DUF4097 and DUF4098 domain-containing protein YvlB